MGVRLIEKLDLHLFPLPLKIRNLPLELHSRVLLLVSFVDGRPQLFLIPKIKVIVQIVVIPIPAVIRTLVGALGHLVEIGRDESAQIDYE